MIEPGPAGATCVAGNNIVKRKLIVVNNFFNERGHIYISSSMGPSFAGLKSFTSILHPQTVGDW